MLLAWSNYLSLLPREQPFNYINDDGYTALILEKAEKLYNKLTTKITRSNLYLARLTQL